MKKNIKIKNLKINFRTFSKFAIVTAMIASLTGCSFFKKKSSNVSINNQPQKPTFTQEDKEYLSQKDEIVVNDNEYVIEDYDYMKLYNLDNYYNSYTSASTNIEHPNSIISGDLTVDNLYNIIKSNNDSYMSSMSKTTSYKEISNSNLRNICGYIVNALNKYINLSNKEEVNCILSNLKIFTKDIFANANVSDNNIMLINDDFFSIFKKTDMSLEEVITHETMHLLQKSCKDRREIGENYIGVSKMFDDKTIENFSFSWLYEGSAEKCSSNILREQPVKYLENIKYINIFNFISMDSNFKLEEVSFSKDVNLLFDKFNVQNEADKKELLNVLFSIEIVNNKPSNICGILNSNYDSNKIYRIMKRDIYKYFTKLFYTNLKNNANTMDVESVFKNIALFEAMINSELGLDMSSQVEFNNDFISDYLVNKNNFFGYYTNILGDDASYLYESYLSVLRVSNIYYNNDDTNSLFNTYRNFIGINMQNYLEIYNENVLTVK